MTQAIVRTNPPTLPNAGAMGYSQISIVERGRMAYISGKVAWRPNWEPPPAVGAGPQGIVIARCFMTDLTSERLERIFPPLLEMFNGAMPCITGVGVAALAAPDLQVELELPVRLPA